MMDEVYRLVFRGEVLEGQHVAVVKKRLVDALKLSDEQGAKLFSGSAVVLKREADTKTAARYQGLFKKAGARLRVMPVEEGGTRSEPAANESSAAAPAAAVSSMQVLPVGSDVLSDDERPRVPVVNVDTSHLGIQQDEARPFAASTMSPMLAAVTVPEFSIAELGVDLAEHIETRMLDIDPHFELAEVGADIPSIPVNRTPVIDIESIRFDLAEVGADIGMARRAAVADVPDISHLSLVAD